MDKQIILLIVDDDKGHSELLKLNIRRWGIHNHIIQFKDGESILKFLESNTDGLFVLLLDIRMPGMDGLEVLQKIKEHQDLNHLPVIMITTTESLDEVNRCYELGCFDYFTKPIDYSALCKSLEKAKSEVDMSCK